MDKTAELDLHGAAESRGIRRFQFGTRHIAVDLPHLLLLLGILSFCLWYFFNARAASTDVQNLLLIEPAVILAVVFALLILRDIVRVSRVPEPVAPRENLSRTKLFRVVGSMVLLGAYVGLMDFIGFDLATALYVLGNLLLLGERRVAVLATVPILFAAITVFAFKQVVSIPFPMVFGFLT